MIDMIDPVTQIFATGMVVGIFLLILVGAVAVLIESKGKRPEFVAIPNEYEDGHWICPVCGADVSVYEWKSNYCSDCGQKIDWRWIDG